MEDPTIDEQTALLSEIGREVAKRTPLPKFQLCILLVIQLGGPIAGQSIYPYINQLITELGITGGDKRKVGYYAGLIESLFYATEAVTILHWGRVSDRIGRKPVILIGLLGSGLSMICFGLSRTFWTLVLSRCLCGMLNGNMGVVNCVLAELTDPTNRPDAVAVFPVVWSIGTSIAPMIGGFLSRPHDRFPTTFTAKFWKEYPYFLPCLAVAVYAYIAFSITLLFFKETLHRSSSEIDTPKPLPLRKILTYPVIISVSNYFSLAFMEILFLALIPLFMSTPIEFGGLGFTPETIGYVLGARGAFISIFQLFFFVKLMRRFGERRIFISGMLTFPVISLLIPLISVIARQKGVTWIVWSLLAFGLSLMAATEMCFGCIFNYITASSPSKSSLGATNGISQMTGSLARATGPWLATSMFALSVEKKLLDGYAVYAVLFAFSCLSLLLASRLPAQVWDMNKTT